MSARAIRSWSSVFRCSIGPANLALLTLRQRGALYASSSAPTISRCRLDNTLAALGGAIYLSGSEGSILNSSLIGNLTQASVRTWSSGNASSDACG